ncbi:MAG: hypothetical protein ACYTEZ_07540 [Planctomycetota bacterium]|jgi:hypothetical protein
MHHRILAHLDLFAAQRPKGATARAAAGPEGKAAAPTAPSPPSAAWLAALWGALVLGILAKMFLDSLSGQWKRGWLISLAVALVLSVSLFPMAYRNAMNSTNPSVVQLCVTFTMGLGVKSLTDAGANLAQ